MSQQLTQPTELLRKTQRSNLAIKTKKNLICLIALTTSLFLTTTLFAAQATTNNLSAVALPTQQTSQTIQTPKAVERVQVSNPTVVPIGNATPTVSSLSAPIITPTAPALNAKAFILLDADTGQILGQKSANTKRPPASLTKLMVLYIAFNELKSGQISLTDKATISKKAWKTGGSRMFLKAGSRVPVEDLIQGIIVDSGNDATVALSQYIAGSEKAFVTLMNQQAQTLGMINTHYADVDGLPVAQHHSSAFDLALLTRAIIHNFPAQYHWFGQKHLTWSKIHQANRNGLLWRDPSVDGLKTGHTEAAGYCLIASAKRDGMRLISVVMGTPTERSRVSESERLLNYGFRFYKTYTLYAANTPVSQARVWGGAIEKISLGVASDLNLTIPKAEYAHLKIKMKLKGRLHAPVLQGQEYGTLTVTFGKKILAERPIVALQNDPTGGLWTRFSDYISLTIHSLFSSHSDSNNNA